MNLKKTLLSSALIAGLGLSSLASAQAIIEIDQKPNFIGGGLGTTPDYKGSDDNKGGLAPYARYTFKDSQRYIQLFANEINLNLSNSKQFRFGPLYNYHFGRNSDVKDSVVKNMTELKGTSELGVFGDIAFIDDSNPRNRFLLGAALLSDAGSESNGTRARVTAKYWRQVHTAVDLHIGGGFTYGDDNYNDHYFGVNQGNVGTSGLANYRAKAGINEVYTTLGATMYLSKNWVLGAGVRAGKIIGDAADSPLVKDRGSDTQITAGLGLSYILWQ